MLLNGISPGPGSIEKLSLILCDPLANAWSRELGHPVPTAAARSSGKGLLDAAHRGGQMQTGDGALTELTHSNTLKSRRSSTSMNDRKLGANAVYSGADLEKKTIPPSLGRYP